MVNENIVLTKSEKISLANKIRWSNPENHKKQSEKTKAQWQNPEMKSLMSKGISESRTGKHFSPHSEATKLKMSINNGRYWKGKHRSEEFKRNASEINKEFRARPEVKKQTSEVSKKLWQDEVYREIVVRNAVKGLMISPSSYEQKIIDLIKEFNLPFKYTGNGEFILAGLNPDFLEVNGKKLLIETYAKFWHPKNYEKKRYAIFKGFGFRTLFLTDKDLNVFDWKAICLNKIQVFLNANY